MSSISASIMSSVGHRVQLNFQIVCALLPCCVLVHMSLLLLANGDISWHLLAGVFVH